YPKRRWLSTSGTKASLFMLQSGNGCDELTLVIGKRSRMKPAQMSFQPSLSAKSAQLIPQQLRREPIKALRVCIMPTLKYWKVIADKLSGAGWSWSYRSAMTLYGWHCVVDVRRNDGRG